MDHKYILNVLFDCLRVSQEQDANNPLAYLTRFPAKINTKDELQHWLLMATESQTVSSTYAFIELEKCAYLIATGQYIVSQKNVDLIPNLMQLINTNHDIQLLISCVEEVDARNAGFIIHSKCSLVPNSLIKSEFEVCIPSNV
ncbi:hypothetical protein [Photobacterium leiognathi]|uniref:hypothetical protein n=1 Tax=Photobacterium leiognathi TaxID=553611 RepID=UPI0027387E81|nr:hypothetical protein [Photobacterium leiognathi]